MARTIQQSELVETAAQQPELLNTTVPNVVTMLPSDFGNVHRISVVLLLTGRQCPTEQVCL